MKTFALKYLKSGKSVIPCGKDKKPLISWIEFQKRLPTEAEIEKWWTDYPNANIGLVTGKISGISVVDCDLGSDYTKFPETTTIKTGSGGYHLYYAYREGLGNKAGVMPHVDIRSDGGFVLAYPSVTDDKIENGKVIKKGGKYEVVKQLPFQEFPGWVVGEKKETKWNEKLSGVGEGSRNQSASEVIGKLLQGFKVEEWEEVWKLIQAWNTKNNPPLADWELRGVFEGICSREAKKRSNEVPADQDVEVLPLYEVAQQNKRPSISIPTGMQFLDRLMKGGVSGGDVIVISGATGMGKTFFAQSMTYYMAKNKTPTLWFSYEVMLDSLWEKFEEMGADKDFISYSPLKMITGDIGWVEKKIKESIEKYKTKVVFLDHLGFLTKSLTNPNEKGLSINYSIYLASLCRQIKKIAIDNNITVFLLVHRIQDRNKTDDTSDIANSAGIAQEADVVMMIRRQKAARGNENIIYTDYSWISVTKNRKTGNTGKICLEKINNILSESVYHPDSVRENIDGFVKQ